MVVSQAVATPILTTPSPTPRQRMMVLSTNSGSTVSARCAQVSPVPPLNTLANTESTGADINSAINTASRLSHDTRPIRRRQSPMPFPYLFARGQAAQSDRL